MRAAARRRVVLNHIRATQHTENTPYFEMLTQPPRCHTGAVRIGVPRLSHGARGARVDSRDTGDEPPGLAKELVRVRLKGTGRTASAALATKRIRVWQSPAVRV